MTTTSLSLSLPLSLSYRFTCKQKLSVQVGHVHRIHVNGGNVVETRAHEILQQLRTESTGTDHKDRC